MTSKWQPGQLLFAGFNGLEVPGDLAALLRQGRLGGVILFARNLSDATQVKTLVRSLRACAPPEAPLLVAIDQEGGRVQRLPEPWTRWPPMQEIGSYDDLEHTGRLAAAMARELHDLGIHLDFAPVVDVDTNPENPIIGDRSFGSTAPRVARHAQAFITAMQDAGVLACAKHFPGHGDTTKDSHLELPSLERHDLARLREVELVPFRAAIAAGVASIMTAHVLFPCIDRRRPATMSPDVMALLRDELAYDGVVFSDDLEMKAVSDRYEPREMVAGCLESRVDALLVCRHAGLRDEVLARLERSPDAQIERALERVVALKARVVSKNASDADGMDTDANGDPREASDAEGSVPPYLDHRELATAHRVVR